MDRFMNIEQEMRKDLAELVASTAIGEQISINPESRLHPSSDFCSALELYFPIMLREKYKEWGRESLDGLFVRSARRIGEHRIEFHGTAILITDQCVVPFKSQMEMYLDRTPGITCSLSICDKNQSRIECHSKEAANLFSSVSGRLDKIAWKYEV
jgi:hypothetical protein